MELAYRARDLEQLLRPSAPQQTRRDLLGKVREEVEVEVMSLRAKIIESLRGRGLKLPSAVKSISLLRRMSTSALNATESTHSLPFADTTFSSSAASSSLSEPELRMTFLASRWDCLRSQLEQLGAATGALGASNEDRFRYIKRWIETWREVIGETVTIYNEIFLAPLSSSHSTSTFASLSTSPSPAFEQATIISKETDTSPSFRLSHPQSLLPIFLSQAITSLHAMLLNQLPHLSSISSLSALQTQLAYCSMAFSKFGFEFRHLSNDLIVDCVRKVTIERFQTASEVFGRGLLRAQTLTSSKSGKGSVNVNTLIANDGRTAVLGLEEVLLSFSQSSTAKSYQPPSFVALFPPLAKLLNAHASALNELRLLPLLSVYPEIRKAEVEQLAQCAESLQRFLQIAVAPAMLASPRPSEDTAVLDHGAEQIILKHFTLVFVNCVMPWCIRALSEGVYPDLVKDADEERSSSILEVGISAALLETVGVKIDHEPPGHTETEQTVLNGNGHEKSKEIAETERLQESSKPNGIAHDEDEFSNNTPAPQEAGSPKKGQSLRSEDQAASLM